MTAPDIRSPDDPRFEAGLRGMAHHIDATAKILGDLRETLHGVLADSTPALRCGLLQLPVELSRASQALDEAAEIAVGIGFRFPEPDVGGESFDIFSTTEARHGSSQEENGSLSGTE